MSKKILINVECILELIDTTWKNHKLEDIAELTGLPYDRVEKLVDLSIQNYINQ